MDKQPDRRSITSKENGKKGGRPEGSMNKLARKAREEAKATGDLPHEFLLKIARGVPIYRDQIDPDTGGVTKVLEQYDFEDRKDAAKAAAPYYAPRISAVELITGVSDNELDRFIKEFAAEAGFVLGDGGTEAEETPQGKTESSKPRRRVV